MLLVDVDRNDGYKLINLFFLFQNFETPKLQANQATIQMQSSYLHLQQPLDILCIQ